MDLLNSTHKYNNQINRPMKKLFLITLTAIAFLLHSCNSFAQDKPIGQIPFTINDDGVIIITLKINNKEVSDFVLDTGASVTVISKSKATEFNLTLKKETYQTIGTNGVSENIKKTEQQRVSLNDKIVLKELEMMVIDLSHLGEINGIIGFDLFKEYVTETNFDTKVISFYKRKGKPDTNGYKSIDFVESFCTPEIDISVVLPDYVSFSGKVTFDTGNASSPLIFNSPFVSKNDITSKFKTLLTSESESTGINSGFKVKKTVGVIPQIKIENFNLMEIPVGLSNDSQGMLSKKEYMGNLGLQYIGKFNFILDYNRKKIYLKPNSSFQNAFNFPLSGIGLETKENGIFIKSISKPSMAYDKGLKVGQQLISINDIENKDIKFYKELLENEEKTVSIVVKLEDGSLKTVEILLVRLI